MSKRAGESFAATCKRETKASSLHRNNCEEMKRQEWLHGGDSKRAELCQQDREHFTKTATEASSSSGRPVSHERSVKR